MATEVLRPRDLLFERFHDRPASFHRRAVSPANTEKLKVSLLLLNRRVRKAPSPPPPKPDRNRSAAKPNRSSHHHQHGSVVPAPTTAPVTLLKRGESLSSIADGHQIRKPAADLSVPKQIRTPATDLPVAKQIRKPATDISAPKQIRNPVTDISVPKQIRIAPADIYAGSAFYMSPSPRSVPLPSFFGKKDSNDGATRDLRRLLRLE